MTHTPFSELINYELEDSGQDIRGRVLFDSQGNTIGQIADLLVDTYTGYVDSVILGTSNRVPLTDLRLDGDAVYLREAPNAADQDTITLRVVEKQQIGTHKQ